MAATDSIGRSIKCSFANRRAEEPAPLAKGPSRWQIGRRRQIRQIFQGAGSRDNETQTLGSRSLFLQPVYLLAPKYNNILPFYFHTGLVYKGLIPTRDNDQLMVAFGFGQYSF